MCAILTTASFVAGAALVSRSGVEALIPETGSEGLEWIVLVDDASGAFFAGGWLIVLTTLVGTVALVGFYDLLRAAGPVVGLALVLGIVGLGLVTISHLIPLALAYELVPAYATADETMQGSLVVTFETLAILSLILNYTGNALGWGVAIPLFAVAILTTRAAPRWLGWLGIFVGAVAGWLGLFAPASSAIGGITILGFLAFFVFMASMGVAILLRQRRETPA